MSKKIIASSILGAVLLSGAAFAQGTPSTSPSSSGPSSTVHKANKACVQAAVTKRDLAIKTAQDTFKKAMADARSARQAALQAANQLTDKTAKQAARKAARGTFHDAAKSARAAFESARKDAREQFKAERKTCRASQSDR